MAADFGCADTPLNSLMTVGEQVNKFSLQTHEIQTACWLVYCVIKLQQTDYNNYTT